MALVVVAYPNISNEHYTWIQTIRARYDPQYSIVNPHFTLVFPCLLENQEELIMHVEEKVKGVDKILFSIKQVISVKDPFNENTNLFLIPDIGSDHITELHNKLYTGLLASEIHPDIRFVPHITMGTANNPLVLQDLEKGSTKLELDMRGTLDSLDVVIYTKGQPVKTIKRINLGKL
jgi:2'-5' RNA ligase